MYDLIIFMKTQHIKLSSAPYVRIILLNYVYVYSLQSTVEMTSELYG